MAEISRKQFDELKRFIEQRRYAKMPTAIENIQEYLDGLFPEFTDNFRKCVVMVHGVHGTEEIDTSPFTIVCGDEGKKYAVSNRNNNPIVYRFCTDGYIKRIWGVKTQAILEFVEDQK